MSAATASGNGQRRGGMALVRLYVEARRVERRAVVLRSLARVEVQSVEVGHARRPTPRLERGTRRGRKMRVEGLRLSVRENNMCMHINQQIGLR